MNDKNLLNEHGLNFEPEKTATQINSGWDDWDNDESLNVDMSVGHNVNER